MSLNRLFLIILVFTLVVSACSTWSSRPVDSFSFPKHSASAEHFRAWFDNDLHDDFSVDDIEAIASIEALLFAGEKAYWDGDVEHAFEVFSVLLQRDVRHPLARIAASRIYEMRHDVLQFEVRAAEILDALSLADVQPMTRLYLAMLGQAIAHATWSNSQIAEPFLPHAWGLPTAWRVSPMMSPWRVLDFDTSYVVEQQSRMDDTYLSPQIAVDTPANWKRTQPLLSQQLGIFPRLPQSGIYYFETFLTIDDTESSARNRTFWVHGNFAPTAQLWIGGKEVFRYDESYTDTAQRYRLVELSPGTHRILIKLAYQNDYRDWFDFSIVDAFSSALEDATLSFSMTPPQDTRRAKIRLRSPVYHPGQLEPVFVEPARVASADDVSLYLTATVAHQNRQSDVFDAAWNELMARHPEFASGYALKALQVQSLWEVPAESREAMTVANLREALAYDADNLHSLLRFARWQRGRAEERDVRELFERAYELSMVEDIDGPRVRNVNALRAWAHYLEGEGWTEFAERTWREILQHVPDDCESARRLQAIYYARTFYPPLEQITAHWEKCPELHESMILARSDLLDEQLELYRRRALRAPYSSSHQLNLVRTLRAQGKIEQAKQALDDALELIPDALSLWLERAQFVMAEEGLEAASALLRDVMHKHQYHSYLIELSAAMLGEIPLQALMPDGYGAAMAVAKDDFSTDDADQQIGDDSVYVVDFAARQHLPDGMAMTLTHTVVRVLTKGAIDRYAEVETPQNAKLILARTIKQDGTVQVPEDVSGKSTLSMPGLAEGDFVELAYLQFSGSPAVNSHLEGMPFYFRMQNISTLHSEYIILGAENASFMLQNDAPEPEEIEIDGVKGVRFLVKNNPRPRQEPHRVSGVEYLPWIRAYRSGIHMDVFEAERRYVVDALLDLLKPSRQLTEQVNTWSASGDDTYWMPTSEREKLVKRLFYHVSQWIAQPSITRWSEDANHILDLRRGNPLILLKAVYDAAGIEADIFFVKSSLQVPEVFPIGEFNKYNTGILRVRVPGTNTFRWLFPNGPDAMYGAVHEALLDQPAVCVTCVNSVGTTVSTTNVPENGRDVVVHASLDEDGTLVGRATFTYTGTRAEGMRRVFRQRSDDTSRTQFFEMLSAELLSGSTLIDAEVDAETDYDQPLVVHLEFTREQFARHQEDGSLHVEVALFQEPIKTAFASLADRTIPMLINHTRHHRNTMRIRLPDNARVQISGRTGSWELPSEFGNFARSVTVNDDILEIESSIEFSIQRLGLDQYPAFQTWANDVEQSGVLRFSVIDGSERLR